MARWEYEEMRLLMEESKAYFDAYVTTTIDGINEIFTQQFSKLHSEVSNAIEQINTASEQSKTSVLQTIESQKLNALAELDSAVNTAVDTLASTVVDVTNTIDGKVTTAKDTIDSKAINATNVIDGKVTNVSDSVDNKVALSVQLIEDTVNTAANDLNEKVGEVTTFVNDSNSSIGDLVTAGIVDLNDRRTTTIADLDRRYNEAVYSLSTTVNSLNTNLINAADTLLESIKDTNIAIPDTEFIRVSEFVTAQISQAASTLQTLAVAEMNNFKDVATTETRQKITEMEESIVEIKEITQVVKVEIEQKVTSVLDYIAVLNARNIASETTLLVQPIYDGIKLNVCIDNELKLTQLEIEGDADGTVSSAVYSRFTGSERPRFSEVGMDNSIKHRAVVCMPRVGGATAMAEISSNFGYSFSNFEELARAILIDGRLAKYQDHLDLIVLGPDVGRRNSEVINTSKLLSEFNVYPFVTPEAVLLPAKQNIIQAYITGVFNTDGVNIYPQNGVSVLANKSSPERKADRHNVFYDIYF